VNADQNKMELWAGNLKLYAVKQGSKIFCECQ